MFSTIRTMKEHNRLYAGKSTQFSHCIDGGCLVPRTSGYVATIVTCTKEGTQLVTHYALSSVKQCREKIFEESRKGLT